MQAQYSYGCKSKSATKKVLKQRVKKLDRKIAVHKKTIKTNKKKLSVITAKIHKHKKLGNKKKVKALTMQKRKIQKKIVKSKGQAKQIQKIKATAVKISTGKKLDKTVKKNDQKNSIKSNHKKMKVLKKKISVLRRDKRNKARQIKRLNKSIAKNKSKKNNKKLKKQLVTLKKKHAAIAKKLNTKKKSLKVVKKVIKDTVPNVCSMSNWVQGKGFLYHYGNTICNGMCVAQTQTLCKKKNVTLGCIKSHKTCEALFKFWGKQQKSKKLTSDVKICCNVKIAAATTESEMNTKLDKISEECRTFKKS